ncbi:phage major capsid protein [Lysobacter firmicutimachus]|uniref:Phage major capsid protein n=1 Tax=Lysobacter firmicutimachus TaxID=1792846 RepID=A0AAU8MUN4_9GAMM
MSIGVSLVPKGRNYTRAVIVRAMGSPSLEAAQEFAAARWGHAMSVDIAKAAVASVQAGEITGAEGTVTEFFESVRAQTVYGRLAGLRKVPFNVQMLSNSGGVRGFWVGEARPIPLSRTIFSDRSRLTQAKVAAIIVVSQECLAHGGVQAEAVFENELKKGVAASWDEAFIDPANAGETSAGVVVRPSSVTHGAATVVATADPVADIAKLINAFNGNLGAAYFVTDPKTAAELGLYRTGGALAFPDVGPRGGAIVGVPVLTTESSPRGPAGSNIAIIDPTGIAAADVTLDITKAEHAAVLMSDDPAAGPAELVSLFQNDAIALKSAIYTNWKVERAGSVAVLTGAAYGPGN